jgi:radical SAM-linked protein
MNYRYRITYSKTETMRYTGNLDVHKAWERTFRRSKLPLAYSQGFHPQPKIQLACPLPLGFLSDNELLDCYLTENLSTSDILNQLSGKIPDGFKIIDICEVIKNEPTLTVQVVSTQYRIDFLENINEIDLSNNIKSLLDKEHVLRKRRNKEYDLRPLIEELKLKEAGGKWVVTTRLSARQGATGRPEEVLSELGIPFEETRITRELTFLKNN